MLVFNKKEEMLEYLNIEHGFYDFRENGRFADICINFNFETNHVIYARNILAYNYEIKVKNIYAHHICCGNLSAETIKCFDINANIINADILHANDIIAYRIIANEIEYGEFCCVYDDFICDTLTTDTGTLIVKGKQGVKNGN